ncbi:C3a anaphylatoxin chemotactic receptor-like [Sinocyclocheilus grahami]|uniref:C3a anaphylatoxin chemotactic receptor-like n=1 Tax=Sinocyclocheilus grahami TaxID=75366 RepID=UPI0007ACC80E|nr:PREDICTED: C3a anaphylatoxin chemotactic receptor-like [Sinocyclocheilus grahami]
MNQAFTDYYINESSGFNYCLLCLNESETHSVSPEVNDSMWILSLVIYCLTFLLGVPGNMFVVYIAGMKMKRTVNTIWFLNLATADLLCCLSIPFSVAQILLNHHWPYGSVMCKILPSVIVITMFASTFSEFNITLCTFHADEEVDSSLSASGTLSVIRFVFGFLIPLICITTCYGVIAHKLGRSTFHSGRAVRIMLAVIVAFFLCWLPYHIVDLIAMYGEDSSSSVASAVDPLAVSLAYVNSCLNPVLLPSCGYSQLLQNVSGCIRRSELLQFVLQEPHA